MAEKKVKIDLKERLGRASRSGPRRTSSTPGPGGIVPPPAGIAPPAEITGGTSGLPAPPFAAKPSGPAVKKDGVFGAVEAGSVAPKPQDIKIEISSDVVEHQKKGVMKIVIAAVAAAALGIGMGWAFGSMQAKANVNKAAVRGALDIAKSIEKSKSDVEQLKAILDKATKSIYREKKFPKGFADDLNKVRISFSAADLTGKNIDRLKRPLIRGIFDYARDAQQLEKLRESTKRLFDARQKAIMEIIEQGKERRIKYVVFVQRDRKGHAVGTFARLSKSFKMGEKKWPDELGIRTGAEIVKAKRYNKGEPFTKMPRREGEKPTVYAIPLEPDGVIKVFPPVLAKRVEKDLKQMNALVNGSAPGTTRPGEEKAGLLKSADQIVRELKSMAAH